MIIDAEEEYIDVGNWRREARRSKAQGATDLWFVSIEK